MSLFQDQVSGFFAQVRVAAQEAAAGIADEALDQILEMSPQYSGDFVSSWVVSSASPDPNFRPWNTPGTGKIDESGDLEAFKKGDQPAIRYAKNKAKPRFAGIRANVGLGVPIFLSNSAKHDQDYAWKIEKDEISFRPVNPDAARVVRRAAEFIARKYKYINGNQLDALRKVGK